MIPLFKVFMSDQVDEPAIKTLHSGFIGQGPVVNQFEEALAARFDQQNVLALSAGTHGLHLALILAGVKRGAEVISSPLTCVSYLTSIETEEGFVPIGHIVNQKKKVRVKTLDVPSGQIDFREVTNWIKLPSPDNWHILTLRDGPNSNSRNYKKRHVWLTGDHKILTNVGFKRADDVAEHPEWRVATDYRCPNTRQLEFIYGTMLGDGYVQVARGNGRLCFTHSQEQAEWVEYKKKALSGLGAAIYPRKKGIALQTQASPFFNVLRKSWYSTNWDCANTKRIPRRVQVTPLMLATWFMDDGSLGADGESMWLCTEDFGVEYVWELFYILVDQVGLKPTMQKHGSGYRIYLGNGKINRHNSAKQFAEIIAPYVIPSMRYKLPHEEALLPFEPGLWDLGEADVYYMDAVVAPGVPPKHEKPGTVYCIEVEGTHNFVTKNIVLSNCTATNWPILMQGASPVWADIKDDFNIDPKSVKERLTSKTKAIICIHWGGYPCDLSELRVIAAKAKVALIEDAAHAYGATYQGSPIGACGYSDFTMMSFQAIKHLTTVDGGALFCATNKDYRRGKLLRWYGIDREGIRTDFRCEAPIAEFGYKYHMNDVCATIGLANMPEVETNIQRTIETANYYNQELSNVPGVRVTQVAADRQSSYWLYTILVENRSDFCSMMASKGIAVSRVHERNDKHPCTVHYHEMLPNLEEVVKKQICIPVGWWLSQSNVEQVVSAIRGGW